MVGHQLPQLWMLVVMVGGTSAAPTVDVSGYGWWYISCPNCGCWWLWMVRHQLPQLWMLVVMVGGTSAVPTGMLVVMAGGTSAAPNVDSGYGR
jgi:hypothetical protein